METENTITAHVIRFRESEAYTRLMVQLRASTRKGMSGTFGPTRMLTWWMAGRVMWTLQRYGGSVTLLSAQDEPNRMGLHTLQATPEEAIAAINDVMNFPGDMRDDDTVFFG